MVKGSGCLLLFFNYALVARQRINHSTVMVDALLKHGPLKIFALSKADAHENKLATAS